MRFERIAPSAGLASRIESFVFVEGEEGFENTLGPNPAPSLGFRLSGLTSEVTGRGEERLPALVLTGVNLRPRVVRYHPGAAMLVVRFREGAAGGLFRTPLHELAGLSVGLDLLVDPAAARELGDRLAEAADGPSRVALLERFFLSRWREPDALAAETLRRIRLTRGRLSLRKLADDLGTNLDTLEKRFRGQTGVSPKRFARLARFEAAVAAYRPGASLAEIALSAGYYDQPHLTREFRSLTGETPAAYLSRPPRW